MSSNQITLTFLLIIITIISSPNFIKPSISTLQSNTQKSNTTSFIKTLCNTTTYPSLCRKTCIPYASKIASNPQKLVSTALSATLSVATTAASAVAKLSQRKNLTKFEANVVQDCKENIEDSVDRLKQSIEQVDDIILSKNGGNLEFKVSNIKTWMSACVTYENTCMESIEEGDVSDYVKDKLIKNILIVAKLTTNALSLCNHLH